MGEKNLLHLTSVNEVIVKSINNMFACRFFERTPSRNRQIVKICEVMDLFLRKPFWFFLSMLPILGSIRLHSRALYIMAAMDVSVTRW